MTETNKKMLSVSDINSWLYCQRKLYLTKICGLKTGMNRNMGIGILKHNILESFSKKEKELIAKIDKDYEKIDLAFAYDNFLREISNSVFLANQSMLTSLMIDKEDVLKKVVRDFSEDIKLRVSSIKEQTEKGIFSENILKNLDNEYVSELRLESPELGLRGRVDRVLFNKKLNLIVPFELKSREERIFLSDELQLTAYAMLLEYHYKQPIKKGIVEVGNNKQEIEITEEKKQQVNKILEQIRNLKEDLVPPMQSNFNKCKSCEFKEECMKI